MQKNIDNYISITLYLVYINFFTNSKNSLQNLGRRETHLLGYPN